MTLSRRALLQGAGGALLLPLMRGVHIAHGEPITLYNGITLGNPWPPNRQYADAHPVRPPYLADRPAVVPIDVGRQLFVDDFLVEETTLGRTFHQPRYHDANPILRPEKPWELFDEYADRTKTPPNPSAMVFSDGVFFDPRDRLFKMWYMAGYGRYTCQATSRDGVTWEKPVFNVVPGTNVVHTASRDSTTIWLDQFELDPAQRFKMSYWYDHALVLSVSPDGVHWTDIGQTGRAGDRSTFFYNPFRRVWCFSIRADQFVSSISGRYRHYWEAAHFGSARSWNGRKPVAWVKSDTADFARPGVRAELYNLDCVAYESLMLGFFTIWRGESQTREKINEVAIGFSRDGFHWDRPDRATFLPVSDAVGAWNWANVQSAGGGCLVVGDLLHFYVSGRQGRPGTADPGVCTTGLATLRRDGFASMDWLPDQAMVTRRSPGNTGSGTLTTRPIRFEGGHLFVNADVEGGELRVEALERNGAAIAGFTAAACDPVRGNGTRLPVTWPAASLRDLAGQAVRFRFSITRGRLYAFWVSAHASGESRGYPAAGGPEFTGPVDGLGPT